MNKKTVDGILIAILCALVVVFLAPIAFIVLNSFKGKFFISEAPFSLPTAETFVGLENYVTGLEKTGMLSAIGWSFFITIGSVAIIIVLTAMTAYYITRVKSKITSVIYYAFVFSMIVPFQMVMFPMTKLADTLHLNTPVGMILLYVGFGSGYCPISYFNGRGRSNQSSAGVFASNCCGEVFQIKYAVLWFGFESCSGECRWNNDYCSNTCGNICMVDVLYSE